MNSVLIYFQFGTQRVPYYTEQLQTLIKNTL